MSWFFEPLKPRTFDFVCIDPPWRFDVRSQKGIAKSPQAQYRTMTLDEVAALPVRELLSDGGVVAMWGTWPLFGKQHMICENAWGLRVATGGAWAKRTVNGHLRTGTGFIFRSVCEPFLIATLPRHKLKARGRAYNLIETFDHLLVDGLAREHSRKPDEWYRHIEQQTPGWNRADIFSRERRKNWTSWGDQTTKF